MCLYLGSAWAPSSPQHNFLIHSLSFDVELAGPAVYPANQKTQEEEEKNWALVQIFIYSNLKHLKVILPNETTIYSEWKWRMLRRIIIQRPHHCFLLMQQHLLACHSNGVASVHCAAPCCTLFGPLELITTASSAGCVAPSSINNKEVSQVECWCLIRSLITQGCWAGKMLKKKIIYSFEIKI